MVMLKDKVKLKRGQRSKEIQKSKNKPWKKKKTLNQ